RGRLATAAALGDEIVVADELADAEAKPEHERLNIEGNICPTESVDFLHVIRFEHILAVADNHDHRLVFEGREVFGDTPQILASRLAHEMTVIDARYAPRQFEEGKWQRPHVADEQAAEWYI